MPSEDGARRCFHPLKVVLSVLSLVLFLAPLSPSTADAAALAGWGAEWPNTDFSRHTVPLREIESGGVPKDGISSIDQPRFTGLQALAASAAPYPLDLGEEEPVIAFEHAGDARAYPVRILMRHEIVNDVVGGLPVTVTYCPLCNTSIVFDRNSGGRTLDFGVSGKLRNSDLVMYDRQTESWWQQFTGEAIVGELAGTKLRILPSRLESLTRFRDRYPNGQILLPVVGNPGFYVNPYRHYDSRRRPLFYDGALPRGIRPMARIVAVEDRAWALELLAQEKRIEDGGIVLTWSPGQNSALAEEDISQSDHVGNVVVQRRTENGLEDIPYTVTFAFVFHAFHPRAEIRR